MNRIATLAITLLLFLPATALAQTRSRTTRRGAQSSRTAKPSASPAADEAKSTGANKVAEQIKNLTRFVYLLGGVAKGIEQVDEAARKNEASPAALQQNEQNKAVVKTILDTMHLVEGRAKATDYENPSAHSLPR